MTLQEILATMKALHRKIDQIGEATKLKELAQQTERNTSARF
jgi:hypothetical protein